LPENRGFTLIEALVTAAVLAVGLVAAASVFSLAVRVNAGNRQSAAGTALLADKMEQFRSASFADPVWMTGDGSDEVKQDGGTYIRTWSIRPGQPRALTVIVYVRTSPLTNGRLELIRASTLRSPDF
jgi:prepilin-type N-terminal cleavage/methylation domain-containing protein